MKNIALDYVINNVQENHEKALSKIREKDRIKIAFFVLYFSVWKLDKVFQLMLMDSQFEPVIVVCPYMEYGKEHMLSDMNRTVDYFESKGYKTIRTYNEQTGEWFDVKKNLQPDIVFFTNPHDITKNEYYIANYKEIPTCYVPYNFGNSHLFEMFHNQYFHNLLWKLFAETEMHKQFSIDYAYNKGVNVCVTGYPGTDIFFDTEYVPKDTWKVHPGLKKIIWAPHHTIDDDKSFLSFSSFLVYADYMLRLVEKYKNSIQLTFKPHPILKSKLYKHPDWGKEKTDKYYNLWNELETGQLEEGSYEDLFLTSDAMIHDSGSFLIEYLYLNKPVLRTDRDDSITKRLNPFGVMAYNEHYHARTEEDIENFIKNVIAGKDEMKEEREKFRQEYLLPPNNQSASRNIFDEIKKNVR
ncbi:MAG: CDP-glycerol glycerophosphotransferase family protein [Candidatus Symbiothrix sp.]|jgi:CDP-glycerol glycerophosphotransferase (TagB/SpsB family)|nr:CDP-glycerol glycerophosphotransferase family protein [Candidatus Symbiothrix sp.]